MDGDHQGDAVIESGGDEVTERRYWAPSTTPPPRGGVLIVDDEPTIRRVLTEVLEEAGYNPVFEAENGTQALSVLEANGDAILVVLLDLMMPDLSGMEVMKHLVNVHRSAVGVIVVTGHAEIMAMETFFALGTETVVASDYLVKPFLPKPLLCEIERTTAQIQAKRRHIQASVQSDFEGAASARLDRIEAELRRLSRREHGFLAELGLDLVRALIVAAALLAMLLLGVGDFVRRALSGSSH